MIIPASGPISAEGFPARMRASVTGLRAEGAAGRGDVRPDPLSQNPDAVALEIRNGSARIYEERDASGPLRRRAIATSEAVKPCSDLASSLFLPDHYPESVSSDYASYRLWRGLNNIGATGAEFFATQGLLAGMGISASSPMVATLAFYGKDALRFVGQLTGGAQARQADADPPGWLLKSNVIYNAMQVAQSVLVMVPGAFLVLAPLTNAVRAYAVSMEGAALATVDSHQALQNNLGEMQARNGNQNLVTAAIGSALAVAASMGAQALLGPAGAVVAAAGFAVVAIITCDRAARALEMNDLTRRSLQGIAHHELAHGTAPTPRQLHEAGKGFPTLPLQVGVGLAGLTRDRARFDRLRDLYNDDRYLLDFDGSRVKVALDERAGSADLARAVFQAQLVAEYAASPAYRAQIRNGDRESATMLALELSHAATPRDFSASLASLEALGWNTSHVGVPDAGTRVRWKSAEGENPTLSLQELREAMQRPS